MKCVTSKLEDLFKISTCHKSAFPKALSSKLGYPFINKMMEWYIMSDRGVLFHVVKNDEIIGYCGGIITKKPGLHGAVTSISQYSFNTFVISYLKKPWLLFHSENIKKMPYIIKNILLKFRLFKKNENIQVKKFQPFMGLVVIALKKENQGQGVGAILLKEFESIAGDTRGIKKISLSVKPNNRNAIKAYKKNGWLKEAEDKNSIKMVKFL